MVSTHDVYGKACVSAGADGFYDKPSGLKTLFEDLHKVWQTADLASMRARQEPGTTASSRDSRDSRDLEMGEDSPRHHRQDRSLRATRNFIKVIKGTPRPHGAPAIDKVILAVPSGAAPAYPP